MANTPDFSSEIVNTPIVKHLILSLPFRARCEPGHTHGIYEISDQRRGIRRRVSRAWFVDQNIDSLKDRGGYQLFEPGDQGIKMMRVYDHFGSARKFHGRHQIYYYDAFRSIFFIRLKARIDKHRTCEFQENIDFFRRERDIYAVLDQEFGKTQRRVVIVRQRILPDRIDERQHRRLETADITQNCVCIYISYAAAENDAGQFDEKILIDVRYLYRAISVWNCINIHSGVSLPGRDSGSQHVHDLPAGVLTRESKIIISRFCHDAAEFTQLLLKVRIGLLSIESKCVAASYHIPRRQICDYIIAAEIIVDIGTFKCRIVLYISRSFKCIPIYIIPCLAERCGDHARKSSSAALAGDPENHI